MNHLTTSQLQKKIARALTAYGEAERARRAADGDLANDRFLDTEELCELRLALAKADRLVEKRGIALDRLESEMAKRVAAANEAAAAFAADAAFLRSVR